MKNTTLPPKSATLYNMIYSIKIACTPNLNFAELHIVICISVYEYTKQEILIF